MRLITLTLMAALAAAQAGAAPQTQDKAAVALKAAMDKEVLDGNLKAAIEAYKKLAQGKDRAVAAKALVRMGQCYDKLGDTEARKAYERVVREFADQKDAVEDANKHLVALGRVGTATGPVARLVSAIGVGTWVFGPSPDGRFLLQRSGLGLELRDITTGETRLLTKDSNGAAAFSRDGKTIAFVRWSENASSVWTVRADGKDERLVWRPGKDWHVESVLGWLPDGIRLIIQAGNKEPHRLMSVSLSDGSTTTLKEDKWFPDPQLSPDGKFVAYSRRVRETPAKDEIRLLSMEDHSEAVVFQDPAMAEDPRWTPDSKGILFTGDQRLPGVVRDLWMLRVSNGKPQGRAELVKTDMGESTGAVTSSGTYYYKQSTGFPQTLAVEFDPASGKTVGEPTPVSRQSGVMSGNPSISYDGHWLSFFRSSPDKHAILVMHSLETDEEKVFPTVLPTGMNTNMFPDGSSVVAIDWRTGPATGFLRIDANTGSMTTLKNVRGVHGLPEVSPDGRTLFYNQWKSEDKQWHVLAWEIGTGNERDLLKGMGPTPRGWIPFSLSRDGSQLAVVRLEGNDSVIEIMPAAGGPRREIHRVPEMCQGVLFWPDGRHLLFPRAASKGGRVEMQRIPVEGGQPQNIGIGGPGFGKTVIHPGGRRIYYVARSEKAEVWALENFLPKAAK